MAGDDLIEAEPKRGLLGLPWQQPEFVWAVALAAGFLGTWLGIASRVPGVGAILATTLYAPLYIVLLRRGKPGLAAFTSIAWCFGILLAPLAAARADSFAELAPRLLLARSYVDAELGPLVDGGGADPIAATLRNAVLALAVVALARPALGLGALLGLSLLVGTLGGGAAWFSERAVRHGADPVASALAGIAPFAIAQLLGLLLCVAALADPAPLRGLAEPRRRMLVGGALLVLAGLAVQPALAVPWGAWLGEWLRP